MRFIVLFFVLFFHILSVGQINADFQTIKQKKIRKVETLIIRQCPINKMDRDTIDKVITYAINGSILELRTECNHSYIFDSLYNDKGLLVSTLFIGHYIDWCCKACRQSHDTTSFGIYGYTGNKLTYYFKLEDQSSIDPYRPGKKYNYLSFETISDSAPIRFPSFFHDTITSFFNNAKTMSLYKSLTHFDQSLFNRIKVTRNDTAYTYSTYSAPPFVKLYSKAYSLREKTDSGMVIRYFFVPSSGRTWYGDVASYVLDRDGKTVRSWSFHPERFYEFEVDPNNLKMEQVIPGKFSVNIDNITYDQSLRYLEELDRHHMMDWKRRDISEGAVGDRYPVKFLQGYTLKELSKGTNSMKVIEYYR